MIYASHKNTRHGSNFQNVHITSVLGIGCFCFSAIPIEHDQKKYAQPVMCKTATNLYVLGVFRSKISRREITKSKDTGESFF